MKGLRVTFDTKMGDGFFPVKFDDLLAEIRYEPVIKDGPIQVDGVTIDHIPLQHPQGGFGFRFREGDKTFIFITDNELTIDAWAERRPEDYERFCMDADVLIHDCQYTPEERDLRKGWGHSDYDAVLDLAKKACVKKLILFHHDPARKDPEVDNILKHCQNLAKHRNLRFEIDSAREGHELIL
jgi:ribonuclease BN (tRNA processing enzyme)